MRDPLALLVVSPRLPDPIGKADSRTVYRMIEYLAGRGHQVHLASFTEPGDRPDALAQLDVLCASRELVPIHPLKSKLQMARGFLSREPMQVWYYRYAAMHAAVGRIVRGHSLDLLYGHLFRSAQYLERYVGFPRILALQISYTLNYQRLVEQTRPLHRRLFYQIEHARVARYEPRKIEAFERVLLISPHDRAALDPESRFRNIFFNPHGIEVDYYEENLNLTRQPDTIVLTADFEAPTNVDAALYFYHDIFPYVRRSIPEAQLWLVGRKPPRSIERLTEDAAVRVTGFVEDIRPYLQQAMVAIDPLRIGAGMQNKVLVSMACGLPVVATRMANEGIQAPEGDVLALADEPEAFAREVVDLLRNDARRKRMCENARAFVRQYWTWNYHFEKLEEMMLRLVRYGEDEEIQQYYPLILDVEIR